MFGLSLFITVWPCLSLFVAVSVYLSSSFPVSLSLSVCLSLSIYRCLSTTTCYYLSVCHCSPITVCHYISLSISVFRYLSISVCGSSSQLYSLVPFKSTHSCVNLSFSPFFLALFLLGFFEVLLVELSLMFLHCGSVIRAP